MTYHVNIARIGTGAFQSVPAPAGELAKFRRGIKIGTEKRTRDTVVSFVSASPPNLVSFSVRPISVAIDLPFQGACA